MWYKTNPADPSPYTGQFKNWTKEKLEKKLAQIERQLEKVRGADPRTDGWQTQRYAKKSRKWDYLAMEKMEILKQLEEK